MLFTTPTQFAVCALLLIAGWFLGLASHTGGRKWKQRYLAERDAHAENRRTWEAEHKTLTRRVDDGAIVATTDADARIADHRARIDELERENDRLRNTTPRARTTARPAQIQGTQRGWFDFS